MRLKHVWRRPPTATSPFARHIFIWLLRFLLLSAILIRRRSRKEERTLSVLLLALSLSGEVFKKLLTLLRRLSSDANEPVFGAEGKFG